MCGRFVLFTTAEALLAGIGRLPGVTDVQAPQGTPGPRYNLAPTQTVPVVRVGDTTARVDPARWGLFPHWKKDGTGPPLFNARAETLADKPSFRDAFRCRRCLVPMDGYYEWHDTGAGKVPYFVSPTGGGLLWAAGLWDTGLDRLSTTMVTTDAPEPLAWLHHRLPRLLAEEEVEQWLAGSPEQAAELLHPSPGEPVARLSVRPVSREVGNVRNDHAGLLAEAGLF